MSAFLNHFEDFYVGNPYWEYWEFLVHSSFTVLMAHMFEHHLVTICTVILLSLAVALGIVHFYRKIKMDVVRARMLGTSRPRFRKRDKVLFYGRKMLRKVNFLTNQATSGRTRMKNRQMVLRFAKR